jgi:hypothetical protein
MKLWTALAIAPFLLAASAMAEAACVYPQPPQALPNGGSATKEEMLAAQGLVKEYVKNVQETYLPCLEKGAHGGHQRARQHGPGVHDEEGLDRRDPREEAQRRAG